MQINEPLERRSFGRGDLVVVFVLGCVCFGFATSAIGFARFNARNQACQTNLKNLGLAAVIYEARMGRFPGYMNALLDREGNLYLDPRTSKPVPVSWAVMLLPELDRVNLRERWRLPPAERTPAVDPTHEFISELVCPDAGKASQGALLSYVANTGRQDLPAARRTSNLGPGVVRDWQANGMLHDNYSEDKLVKTDAESRGPMATSRSDFIRDPKDKTILFTENLDAGSYVFDTKTVPGGDPANAEIGWGCIWGAGKIDAMTMPPTMTPDAPASAINAHIDTPNRKPSYEYCRPSSSHAGGVNVAFAAGNVMFLKDKINYLIFAKLMASDDAGIKTPGTQTLADPTLRMYQITDADLEP